MALLPKTDWTIPAETAALAHACCPNPTIIMTIRDTLGPIFTDAQFVGLFAAIGRPATSPGRLVLVLLFQFLEQLSDQAAADAVRTRIDWKYALGLPLSDQGFSSTVLCDFRQRLIVGSLEEQLLTSVLALAREHGWLDGRRQRTDSSHVLAATAALNRFELVHETLHATLTELARQTPTWLQSWVPAHWYATYGVGSNARRWPKTEKERLALAATIGADGALLLRAVDSSTAPTAAKLSASVAVLRQVWHQQYRDVDGTLVWRTADELPAAAERLVSPYETEARTGAKRDLYWDGYKVHLSETITSTAPQLITHVETSVASEADGTALPRIEQALAQAALTPNEHVVDTGYMSAAQIVTSRNEHGIDLVGPVPADTSWQATSEGGLDVGQFRIDWEARQAIGPAGCVSSSWSERENHRSGTAEVLIRFPASSCVPCPLRARCTRSAEHGRTLTVREQEIHEELLWARARQQTADFHSVYGQRAGVEGTISQGVRSFGLRRSRYYGQAKTHLQNILVALAINLARIAAWVQEVPRSTTRHNPFASLAPSRL